MRIGFVLNVQAKILLQRARQLQAMILLNQPRAAAFTGLAVDTDHRLVATADILRVDGQIGHFPAIAGPAGIEPFFDRILMRAGKGGIGEASRPRVARMNRDLVAAFDNFDHPVHLGEAEPGIDALAVEIHRQRHQTDVTGAFAVAEQAAFDAVGAGHHRQLRAGDAGSPVVMRMDADAHIGAAREVTTKILNLIGINVRRAHFYRRGQIDNHRPFGAGLPDFRHRFANLQREFRLGEAEGFRGILVLPAGLRLLFALLADKPGGAGRQLDHLRFVHSKNQLAEQRSGGVIEVNGGAVGIAQRFEGPED